MVNCHLINRGQVDASVKYLRAVQVFIRANLRIKDPKGLEVMWTKRH